jgi:D-alanyl-D-alanine dipeptidase
VIDGIEDAFWSWWTVYGPKEGLLRPRNYLQRWHRIRVLAGLMADSFRKADAVAPLPIKVLLANKDLAAAALQNWPWNARRRTFCTYHVAMHQSADKTALILRHRGKASVLHESYRGTGVSQELGAAFFDLKPNPRKRAILPARPAKGVIRLQLEKKKLKRARHASARAVDVTAVA